MCARLLSCPLCSQPGFVTLDALRAGLVSVATRPLACPVCNETLIGIDKLTIHLFGHTISSTNRSLDPPRKVSDVNSGSNLHEDSDAMTLPQTWHAHGNSPVVLEEIRSEKRTDEKNVSFVPLTNSARTIATIVINKDALRDNNNPQRYCAENIEKNPGPILFVQNSSQPQLFCSPALTQVAKIPSSSVETYHPSIPIVFHNAKDNSNISCVVSTANCVEKASMRANDAIFQRNLENSAANRGDDKADSEDRFPENWIENLLQNNEKKCDSAVGTKSPLDEEKNFSLGTRSPDGNEKYSNYQQVSSVPSTRANDDASCQVNSQNSRSIPGAEISFHENFQSGQTSNDVLPQLKAFRLLAMNEKSERCNICGIPVPDRNILVLHKQVVHMIAEKDVNAVPEELLKNYPCHFCTKIFKNRGSLMVHMRIAHIGNNLGSLSREKEGDSTCCENGYNCPTCGKNFRKEQHVTQHLKTHEGKQWECDVCSKMFTTKYFLKKHKRLHSGEMPYKCTICDKTFTFQQSYHKHRLYHKDDKPHTCATCGRSFKELSTLHNHERIHTGEKPFVCETCGKCFRQRVSYLVHRRIHTGVMPYKCVACGKNFRYKVSQRTHKCPSQSEDPGQAGDTASANNAQSSTCNHSPTIGKSTLHLMENQLLPEPITASDNNKFILIVNTQGQPILTRESVVGGDFTSGKPDETLNDKNSERREGENHLWYNLPGENISKSSTDSSTERKDEKLSSGDTSDFFSLVMSPLENDLPSPSTEMEHLRLSSPRSDERRQNPDSMENSAENSANILQSDLNRAIDGIFRENCTSNNPLETINEESLKQLLYGIDRKV